MRVRSTLAMIAGGALLAVGLGVAPASADVIDPVAADESVLVEPLVDCDGQKSSGLTITNPASNTQTFYLSSNVYDAAGTPLFGDGGWLAPGESMPMASGGATVEDATYSYDVSQSPQEPGATQPTQPFTEVAAGTYVFDCVSMTTDEVVTVEPSVECDSQYPSGIRITNPASNTATFFLRSNVYDASGAAQFGDGGWLAPGESMRVASGGPAVNVEDATYSYDVSQSPQVPGTTEPTEPFTVVATGTYVVDCQAGTTKYFVTAYDRTVWAVTPTTITALTLAQWQAAGSPTPKPAPTDYVKYPWSSTISAVTFFGQSEDRWVWKHVSYTEWTRAGQPSPRIAGWIKDSIYYQWAQSPQIFVQDVGGVKHALTYPEWKASGFRSYEARTTQGFVKLSWDNNIAFLTDFAAGKGSPINFAKWQAEGFPQPVVKSRFPGDQLYRNYGSSTVWYAGPTVNRPITYAEWSVMGRPAPTVRNVPARPTDKDCDDYPSQQAAQNEYRYYYEAYGDVFLLDGDNDGIACESYFG